MAHYPMPLLRVELAIQTLINDQTCTLMIRRAENPFKGSWALPGGVVRVDLDSDLEATAKRVLKERLGVTQANLTQLIAVGSSGREPRGPNNWGVSIVYRAMMPASGISPVPGKRIVDWAWHNEGSINEQRNLAFDHLDLVNKALAYTREEFRDLRFPDGLIPDQFTLTELQQICEGVLGYRLDKSSFRRKVKDREIVTAIDGTYRSGTPNRPAAVFKLARRKHSTAT
jgi:8-oxo-dGTP diphosphatase